MAEWQLIALLGAVIIVYAFLLPRQKGTQMNTGMIQELEDTMTHFTSEIEEQNEQLLSSLQAMRQNEEQRVLKLQGRVEYVEKELRELSFHYKDLKDRWIREASPVNAEGTSATSGESTGQGESAAHQAEVLARKLAFVGENSSSEEEEVEPVKAAEPAPIRHRYEALFQLYDLGKSMDYIAKKLSMNKGEIQLIIQLAKREEQFRV